MKLKSKRMLLVALAIVAVSAGIVYAAFTVYSNVVHVEMNYAIPLSASQSGSVVTLTAHLTDRGSPVSGATVNFYTCDSGGGSLSYIGSSGTDGSGDAVLNYAVGGIGDYYFIARYDVP